MINNKITANTKSTQKCNIIQNNENFDFNKLINKFRIYLIEIKQGGML